MYVAPHWKEKVIADKEMMGMLRELAKLSIDHGHNLPSIQLMVKVAAVQLALEMSCGNVRGATKWLNTHPTFLDGCGIKEVGYWSEHPRAKVTYSLTKTARGVNAEVSND
jgi:hypothetical protein